MSKIGRNIGNEWEFDLHAEDDYTENTWVT